MRKSSVSRMQRFMYSQNLCSVLEKWIRTQHQILLGNSSWIGSKIHHNTELWTQLMENRWNSSGIFPRIHYIATKSNSSCLKWAINQKFSLDGLSSCRCSMTSCGEIKTMKRNVLLIPRFVSLFAKRFPAGHWSFLGLGSEKKWYSTHDSKPQGEWDRVDELMMIKFGEKRTASFPSHESIVSRTAQKQRRWKIIYTLLCRCGYDWNCFFAQSFLLISSVSTEQSQICVKNTVLVKQERRDPYWQSNLTHCSRQQT